MDETIIISIRGRHIIEGRPCCPFKCPVALAILDLGYDYVTVGDTGAQLTLGSEVADYSMDERGQEFVKSIDSHVGCPTIMDGENSIVTAEDENTVLFTIVLTKAKERYGATQQ